MKFLSKNHRGMEKEEGRSEENEGKLSKVNTRAVSRRQNELIGSRWRWVMWFVLEDRLWSICTFQQELICFILFQNEFMLYGFLSIKMYTKKSRINDNHSNKFLSDLQLPKCSTPKEILIAKGWFYPSQSFLTLWNFINILNIVWSCIRYQSKIDFFSYIYFLFKKHFTTFIQNILLSIQIRNKPTNFPLKIYYHTLQK